MVLGVPTQSASASGGAIGSGSGSATSTIPLQFIPMGALMRCVDVYMNVVIGILYTKS